MQSVFDYNGSTSAYKFNWPYVTTLVMAKDFEHIEVLRTVDAICKAVYARFFNYSYHNSMDKEDILQEGRLKALRMLEADYYDPKYNLKNFLYTGVRNEMQNITARSQKNPLLTGEEDSVFESIKDVTHYDDPLFFDKNYLKIIFESLPEQFLFLVPHLVISLQDRGFVLNLGCVECSSNLNLKSREVLSKLECLSVWLVMENLRN